MIQRSRISLDGPWMFCIDPGSTFNLSRLEQASWRAISVPAPWQSQGEDLRDYLGVAWYRREVEIPPDWMQGAILIGFGAVDYYAEVWVNDQWAGEHEGGYLPFEFDVTGLLQPGKNTITVRVTDRIETFPEVPHGKQSWYGMLSGLWQAVWIERRPETHIRKLRLTPVAEQLFVKVDLSRDLAGGEWLEFEVRSPAGEPVFLEESKSTQVTLEVPHPDLWDIDRPALYTLRVKLRAAQADEVEEPFGFRTIEARQGRIVLNGRPIMLRGALDQGFYPDLMYTPPSVEFLEEQFRKAKALGLNCLRLHIQVADPRYYQAADRVGILIWTELPNWQLLTPEAKRRARETLTGMVDRDWNHPCIVIWTLINESWGVDLTIPEHRRWLSEMYDLLKELDPHRLVVGNSACWGNYHVVTDILDFHNYYAIPDHYPAWRNWVERFAGRPDWTYARPFGDHAAWREFMHDPWETTQEALAPEVRRTGEEPLVVSEFGNWGLPDVEKLYEHYQGEPWWFETGQEWGDGSVYPHNVQKRFRTYHLDRAFPSLSALARASQQQQFDALKYEIEQIRRHDSLAGYVITEFTDVHWESNGLLDMCRNPKAHDEGLGQLNADDLIIPEWSRLGFCDGETCRVDLYLSHYSPVDLRGGRLVWNLDLHPEITGELDDLAPRVFGVTYLGRISFRAPGVSRAQRVRLDFRLVQRDGSPAVSNFLEVFLFPRRKQPPRSLRLFAPEMANSLKRLRYRLAQELGEADLAVTLTMDDRMRQYLLDGGQVLWLAESPLGLQTDLGSLGIHPRRGSSWQGDWASSLSWIGRDGPFAGLPCAGVVDFAFADLTPEHVITGLQPLQFATEVHAGIAVGWLHKPAGLVVERRIGAGRLLVSTFRLSENLQTHPMALALLDGMVNYLASGRAPAGRQPGLESGALRDADPGWLSDRMLPSDAGESIASD